ncbi:MAG: hypothetical protein U1E67_04790 [Hyphomicrobiales bacterium]
MTEKMSDAKAALTDELAEDLKKLCQAEKDSVHQLAIKASKIHEMSMGDDHKFTAEFRQWWKRNQLDKALRSIPNFVQYAKAGDVIRHFENSPNKDKLPHSLSALYALHRADRDYVLRLMQADKISSNSTAAAIKRLTRPKSAQSEFERAPFAVESRLAHKDGMLTVMSLKMRKAALNGASEAEKVANEQALLRLHNQIIALVEASGLSIDVEYLLNRHEVASPGLSSPAGARRAQQGVRP